MIGGTGGVGVDGDIYYLASLQTEELIISEDLS